MSSKKGKIRKDKVFCHEFFYYFIFILMFKQFIQISMTNNILNQPTSDFQIKTDILTLLTFVSMKVGMITSFVKILEINKLEVNY